jgi:MFS family permease
VSISTGFFWAPLQAALADEDRPARLERNIGLFNVCWSVGKGLGFLLGGGLYARWGANTSFLTAAACMSIVAVVLPRHRAGDSPIEVRPSSRDSIPAARLRVFLIMAWVANAIAFGVANTLNLHYPKFLLHLGRGPWAFGLFLACVFIMQAGTMAILRRRGGWKFRRLPSFAVQGALACALLAIPLLGASPVVLIATAPIGIALGFAYHASITYSLLERSARGRQAGMHEAILGSGSFLLPLVGGLIASASGDLRTPYLVCAAAAGIAVSAQEVLFRFDRRAGD